MPGYLHSVPSSFVVLNYGGQAGTKISLIPVHEIAPSPAQSFENENDDGLPRRRPCEGGKIPSYQGIIDDGLLFW